MFFYIGLKFQPWAYIWKTLHQEVRLDSKYLSENITKSPVEAYSFSKKVPLQK